ncbi:uncharacterized protein LOC135706289 isoform X2 [Ochlerotatus camptorhynchus]|uniref:uncharacterized protein LOC135706289 isoform X2 n=1 Tax=Ochlerotatus camptorhynchus TaxID=644619 RepID=UPI0031E3A760
MSVLGLWTLASALGCCIGFTIVQRPAEYYDYRRNPQDYPWQPSGYQWQSLEYQWEPIEYQGQPSDYQPYDYQPYEYQPYDYKPYDYQPSYSNYYYYPSYELSVPYSHDTTKSKLPYGEAQQLLQVYRVIRVIVVFRDPVHKPVTSLDRLVHELTDEALQQKLVELLHNVHGYKEVAELKNDPAVKLKNSFVNDYRRLLLAIQRALNALDLKAEFDDDLCEKLRKLRDQANALTVEQIEAELTRGLKGHAKEALVSDVLENLLGEVETKDLEVFHENYDVVVEGEDDDEPLDLDKVEKYLVVIDEPEEKQKQQEPKDRHEIDDEDLEDLAAALELYLEEQKIAESNLVKEKSTIGHDKTVEPDTTTLSTTTVYTTTHAPLIPIPAEATKDTWLGSLFGNGNLLAGHYGSPNQVPESQKLPYPIDVSQPAVLVEPEELETNKLDSQNVWVHVENPDNEPLDFDIDQRFQSLSTTAASADKTNAATHSVPLWLIENSKNQKVENKQMELKDIVEGQNAHRDELQKQLPDDEDEQEFDHREIEFEDTIEGRTEGDDELFLELPENRQIEAEDITDKASTGEAREIPVDEEKLQTVEEEGPARFNLPVDLSDHQKLNAIPEPVPIVEQQELQRLDVTTESSATPVAIVDQITTLNNNEVHTESAPVESREEPTSVTQTGHTLVDLSGHQQLSSTPDLAPIDEQQKLQRLDVTTESSGTPVPAVDQLTTLNIYEVHTESAPAESREEPTPVTQSENARFNLPVELSGHQLLKSTPESVPIVEQQELQRLDVTTEAAAAPVATVDQLTTLNVYEVHTESAPVESREEPTPVTQTDQSEFNSALQFRPVDIRHPEMSHLVPHIIHQLRLGNVSEQEQLTLAAIFEDLWPLIVEEAFRPSSSSKNA